MVRLQTGLRRGRPALGGSEPHILIVVSEWEGEGKDISKRRTGLYGEFEGKRRGWKKGMSEGLYCKQE